MCCAGGKDARPGWHRLEVKLKGPKADLLAARLLREHGGAVTERRRGLGRSREAAASPSAIPGFTSALAVYYSRGGTARADID
jgi:hypothetical protein